MNTTDERELLPSGRDARVIAPTSRLRGERVRITDGRGTWRGNRVEVYSYACHTRYLIRADSLELLA